MSTKKPTTLEDAPAAVPPTDFWRGVKARTEGAPEAEEEPVAPREEPEGAGEGDSKRAASRPARIATGAASLALVAALAWIVVPALIAGGPAPRHRSASGAQPAKGREAEARGSGRARLVREPGASPRPRRRHAPQARQARRRAHPRPEPPRPAPPPPSQPPVSGSTPPEPAPEPSAPAPPPPAEPK